MPLTYYSTIFLYRVQAITDGSQNNFTLFLYFLTRSTYRILIISIVLMILFVGSSLYLSRINSQQLEATMYMNQYRLGSKTLTAAVQPYAVTGDKTYYNNMKELHEDKNCDIAWEGLQQNGLTDNEWEEINHIAEISEILVQMGQGNYRVEPIEEYKSFLPVLPQLSSELPFDHFSNDFYHHFVHFSNIVI